MPSNSKDSSPFCFLSRQISPVYNHTYGDLCQSYSSHSDHVLHVIPNRRNILTVPAITYFRLNIGFIN